MVDMIFLELALAFVILATLAAVATASASRTVRGIASKTVNGSVTAALVSAALAVWFLYWPPTSTSAPRPNNTPKTPAGQREHDPRDFGYTLRRGAFPLRANRPAPTPCAVRPSARSHPRVIG